MSENTVHFAKMNGLGNQIIVADMRGRKDAFAPAAAIALNADPQTAFDQIMVIHDPKLKGTDARIDILNCDGSMAEACGNGTRCVVQWLNANGMAQTDFTFATKGGILPSKLLSDGMISVDMGIPRFDWESIPLEEEFHDTRYIELQIGPIDDPVLHSPSVANIGNPHAVFWVDEDVDSYALDRFGPMLENHPIFPQRANISIANVTSESAIKLRTWERGAGLTQACGSAACAAAVCAARTERTGRDVTVTLPGGDLHIKWEDNNRITMTGPAEFEFAGLLDPVNGTWEKTDISQSENA